MLMNTHLIIGKSLFDNIDSNKSFLISEKNFLYGNIKPDITSKYLFNKHYLDESLEMIISKITNLCNLTINSLSKYFSISKFSQEIGVICHFLCDFFCVAHSERWEMSHSFSKHVNYEKNLNMSAKSIDLSKYKGQSLDSNFENFFNSLYAEYKTKMDYDNDLYFSTYVCNSVIDYILDCILNNTAESYTLIKCG